MPTCLHIFCGCFYAKAAELSSCNSDICPGCLKYLLSGPLKRNCACLRSTGQIPIREIAGPRVLHFALDSGPVVFVEIILVYSPTGSILPRPCSPQQSSLNPFIFTSLIENNIYLNLFCISLILSEIEHLFMVGGGWSLWGKDKWIRSKLSGLNFYTRTEFNPAKRIQQRPYCTRQRGDPRSLHHFLLG